ncbi:MAG: hypothetical protein ACK4S3_02570 [Parvibaculum sp.]
MGKKKTTTKPVYNQQIEGAANTVTNAYNQAAPGLQAGAQKFGGILDSVLAKYNAGDPTINAARGYTTDVLSGKYLNDGNPYLQQMIDMTGGDVRNGVAASLGTRGLTGGSDYAGIIARELAKNSTGLRFNNYNTERDRMGQAVSQVPGIVAAENGILDPAFQAYSAMQDPIRAAAGYGGSIGGLLGQYTTTTQKNGLLGTLAQLAGNAAQAYAMGG